LDTKRRLRLSLLAAIGITLFTLPAAAFDMADTQASRHRLADYKGRWVIVNFWATWCVPCIQEIPEIAEFHRHNPGVAVIGIATDAADPAKVKQFAAKVGHTYPLVLSDERVEKQLGEPKALPTTKIYDPAGKLVYDRVGRVTRKSLEELTRSRPARSASAPSAQRSRSAFITSAGYWGWPSEPL